MSLLALLIIIFSLGFATPFAIVLKQRWRAEHTRINGHRLIFLGGGMQLFWLWLKWMFLLIITAGIYSFWMVPQVQKWIVENTDFDPASSPNEANQPYSYV